MTLSDEKINEKKKKEKRYFKKIAEWSALQFNECIFDTDIHSWWDQDCHIPIHLMKREKTVCLVDDEDGDIFGYCSYKTFDAHDGDFYWDYEWYYIMSLCPENNAFHFVLESNGRLPGPMKFEALTKKENGYIFADDDFDHKMIRIGEILIYKQEKKYFSRCIDEYNNYDHKGYSNVLGGKIYIRPNLEWPGQ